MVFFETPARLMRPVFIVASDSFIEIFLQILNRGVEIFAQRNATELVDDRLAEALTDAIIRHDASGAFECPAALAMSVLW